MKKETMTRLLRSTVTVIIVMSMLASCTLRVFANDGIMPAFENCNTCSVIFVVDNYLAGIDISYIGDYETFTHMTFEVQIKKKVWGVFWTTIDIGYPNQTWGMTLTDVEGSKYTTIWIDEPGTYKCVYNIKFYGTNGVVDEIDDYIIDSWEE